MPYKKIAFFVFVGILLFTINNLARSIYTTWQKQDLIVKTQKDLDQAKRKNQDLRKKLAAVNQPDFIESPARDNLLLAKPGEGVIMIPKSTAIASTSATLPPPDLRPNWKKWWDVFVKS